MHVRSFVDTLSSTSEKLESLVVVHVGDPCNEFFKTRETLPNLHEPTIPVQNRGFRAMSLFRMVNRDGEMLADAGSLDAMIEIVRNAPTGRYHVDGFFCPAIIRSHRLPMGFASLHDDGSVIFDPDPWDAHPG